MLVCVCLRSVSWLFWLSCRYLPSDWLGSLLMVRRLSPQSPGRRALITYSVQCIVLLCVCLVPRPYIIFREFLCHDVAFCAESAVNQPTHTQTRTEKHALRITITLEHRAVLKWFLQDKSRDGSTSSTVVKWGRMH